MYATREAQMQQERQWQCRQSVNQSPSRGPARLWTFLSRRSPMPPTNPQRRANPRGGQPHFELQSISAMTQQADTGRETTTTTTATIYLSVHCKSPHMQNTGQDRTGTLHLHHHHHTHPHLSPLSSSLSGG